MPSADFKRKIITAMMFILPIATVKAAPLILLDTRPRAAGADPTDAPPPPLKKPPAAFKPTEKQLRASQHIVTLLGEPFGSNPLLYTAAPVVPDPIPVVIVPDPIIEPAKPVKFTLHAVMAGESGRKALIDGRSYIEGDFIRDTRWMVISINPAKRCVELEEVDTHKTMVIQVDLPFIFR
jgi:hypothetical protein